jgi:radical SAM protein with 4Fe4S-binding SPASM domain
LIFHFVITNLNYKELTPLIKLAHSVGVTRIDFDALIAYRPEQKALELNASQQAELAQIASQAKKLAQTLNIQTTLDNFIQNEHVSRGTQAPPSGEKEGLAGAPCLKAWHHLVIQADGRTSPCCVLAGQGGSIRNQSVETLWNNDEFLEQIREAMLKHQPLDRCKECSWNILSHEREIRKNL